MYKNIIIESLQYLVNGTKSQGPENGKLPVSHEEYNKAWYNSNFLKINSNFFCSIAGNSISISVGGNLDKTFE
jgi:hypothetical protein